MTETYERQDDKDPAPLEHSDAERVTSDDDVERESAARDSEAEQIENETADGPGGAAAS